MGCGASKTAQAVQPLATQPPITASAQPQAPELTTSQHSAPQHSDSHHSATLPAVSEPPASQTSEPHRSDVTPEPLSPSAPQSLSSSDEKKSGASTPVAEVAGSPRAVFDLNKSEIIPLGQARETESGVVCVDEGAVMSAQGLRYLAIKHPKMKELQLSGTELDHGCLDAICDLVSRKKLANLTLARVGLDDEGAKTLGMMLMTEEASSLKQIGLDGNKKITDEGAKHLADALYTNKSVEELSLWGAGLGDDGAEALANSLKSNSTLRQLWLGECEELTDRGAERLRDALKVNKSLQQLGLVCTMVSTELQDEIEDLVQSVRG